MTKAIGYCRKSTDRQEQSIIQQKQSIELYARKNGFEVVNWYSDEGISGARFKDRPAFRDMLSACQSNNGFKTILVYDKSRFGRPQDTRELAHYEWMIKETGKDLVYTNSKYRDDGSVASAIMGVVESHEAGQYLENLSRTIGRACISNALEGRLTGRRAPYGYNHLVCSSEGLPKYVVIFDPEKRIKIRYNMSGKEIDRLSVGMSIPKESDDYVSLIPDPEKSKVVKKIYELYVNGFGGRQIAEKLNDEGIIAPMKPNIIHKKGCKLWAYGTIREILRNEAYIGNTIYNKTSKSRYHDMLPDGDIVRKKGKHFKHNSKDKWVIVRNTHKPIISQSLFEKCLKIRENRAHSYNLIVVKRKGRKRDFLLTGLMKCENCGYSFTSSNTIRDGNVYPAYRDGGYAHKGRHLCTRKIIDRDKIEGFILDRIKDKVTELLGTAGLKKIMRQMLNDLLKNGNGNGADTLKKQISEIDTKIENLLDMVDTKHKDIVTAKLDKLSAEKEDLTFKLKQAEAKKMVKINVEKVIDKAITYLRDLKKPYERLAIEQRRELARQFVESIVIKENGEGVVTYYSIPSCDITDPLFSLFVRTFGAGEGNRTLVSSLEGCRSTTELLPRKTVSSAAVATRLVFLEGKTEFSLQRSLSLQDHLPLSCCREPS